MRSSDSSSEHPPSKGHQLVCCNCLRFVPQVAGASASTNRGPGKGGLMTVWGWWQDPSESERYLCVCVCVCVRVREREKHTTRLEGGVLRER